MSSPQWKVESEQATFESAPWRVRFAPAEPQNGLTIGHADDLTQQGALALDLPGDDGRETCSECYGREADLIVGYLQREARTVRPHVYYRVQQADTHCLAVQLILSMQTSLLHSVPTTRVFSCAAEGELMIRDSSGWRGVSEAEETTAAVPVSLGNATGMLLRPADGRHSFFQLIHPTDLLQAETMRRGDQRELAYRLFPESLEKGVIRRARLTAGWTTRQADLDDAELHYQRQLTESPPLTT